ncbi:MULTISPECIES: hypothetical protein [Paraburkholderia]|uniref:hypothetical protein n=1 Tax=Paraburkholderia TaxID=1822464 RepID=UPI00224F3B5D|nr:MULTISPECIES: hypothetical protein [Paraburkholderia]MCX4161557.1 hypothetical protein [Paraburkholderia megapolitana]MDN7157053.1 hypothetical protein [Paraburkholderia sp. CHISQ3]MDQ6494098.1 hypothetical protein [Paraburkholderia megapolitana]
MVSLKVVKMKILIICEHFAPETGAQALQATKVADALHGAGHEVQVLCGVQNMSPEPRLYPVAHVASRPQSSVRSFVARAHRRLRYEFDSIHRGSDWVRKMAREAIEISRTFEPDVVLTQSTPFRVHLIGLHLPESLRHRWLAYFSDLWPLALTPYPYRTRLSCVLKAIQMRALAKVLTSARGALYSNEASVRRLARTWPGRVLPRCDVVAHIGTPASDRQIDRKLIARYGSRFVHIGKITRERAIPQLVDAIMSLGGAIGPTAKCSGFSFVGDVDLSFRLACRQLECSGVVDFVGEVDPVLAHEIGHAARALVVIEAEMDESPFLASKFADYAMMRKPILAISPAGPIRDYLKMNGGGIAATHDVNSIASAISTLLESDQFANGSEALAAHFDERRVANQYLEAFRKLL